MSITKELTEIVKEVTEDAGYEFVDLKYGKRGQRWFLQVFADKEGGIVLYDCEKLSKKLAYELDRHPDLLKHSYRLEVSSPGLDRPLKTEKDFNKFKGKSAKFNFYGPFEEQRSWTGKIIEAKNGKVTFEDKEGQKRVADIEKIAKAKLEVNINGI
ncbi:MAG: ribosome maturation factor RimP [Elusimicrobiota bacterium]